MMDLILEILKLCRGNKDSTTTIELKHFQRSPTTPKGLVTNCITSNR